MDRVTYNLNRTPDILFALGLSSETLRVDQRQVAEVVEVGIHFNFNVRVIVLNVTVLFAPPLGVDLILPFFSSPLLSPPLLSSLFLSSLLGCLLCEHRDQNNDCVCGAAREQGDAFLDLCAGNNNKQITRERGGKERERGGRQKSVTLKPLKMCPLLHPPHAPPTSIPPS